MDEVDLLDSQMYVDGFPHDRYAELRAQGPIHRHVVTRVQSPLSGAEETMGFWCVLGQPEIQQVNRDWTTFSAGHGPTIPRQPPGGAGMLGVDPPEHHRLRQLVSAGFTPRMVGRLEDRIGYWVDRLLDDIADRGDTCDFVAELAFPLPMHVIADIIGIPEADRPWVFERTVLVLDGLDPSLAAHQADQQAAQVELYEYAHQLGVEKRARPTDDVWSTLIAAQYAADDGQATSLEEFEVDVFFLILSIAGSETTRTALSGGLLGLLEHPDQLDRLRSDPERFATLPDEILRWSSPVLSFSRDCESTTEVAGVTIEEGERVVMFFPSGNRDERVFERPFELDVGRDPNPHVAFGGGGPHYCLGANLAKREILVLFRELIDRHRTIEQAGAPEWTGPGPISNVGCHVEHLPVRLERA
ncbi:MAG: cytochrome P450 [Acidimicrobiales bacterium]